MPFPKRPLERSFYWVVSRIIKLSSLCSNGKNSWKQDHRREPWNLRPKASTHRKSSKNSFARWPLNCQCASRCFSAIFSHAFQQSLKLTRGMETSSETARVGTSSAFKCGAGFLPLRGSSRLKCVWTFVHCYRRQSPSSKACCFVRRTVSEWGKRNICNW